VIQTPEQGVLENVAAYSVEVLVISDNVFIIAPLPDVRTGHTAMEIDPQRCYRLEARDEGPQRSRLSS